MVTGTTTTGGRLIVKTGTGIGTAIMEGWGLFVFGLISIMIGIMLWTLGWAWWIFAPGIFLLPGFVLIGAGFGHPAIPGKPFWKFILFMVMLISGIIALVVVA